MRLSLRLRLLRLIGRLGLESRGGRRRQPLGQWREAIGDSREIIIVLAFILCLEGLAAKIICLLLRGRNQTKIVLRVLQQVFSHDDVAGGLGVSRELEIFLRDMLRCAANLDVGPFDSKERVRGFGPLRPLLRPRSLLFCPGLIDTPQQSPVRASGSRLVSPICYRIARSAENLL